LANETEPSLSSQKPSSLLGLLGILGFSFGVWFLSKMKPPIDPIMETNVQQNNTRHESQCRQNVPNSPLRVNIESFPPSPTPENQWEGEKKWKNRREWWMFFVQFLTLIIVGAYAWFTYGLLDETGKAANAARSTYEANWRPWVWVKMPQSIQVEVGKPITAKIEVFNYGLVPALVKAKMHVAAGPRVIDDFRDDCRYHSATAEISPNVMGALNIMLRPQEGTENFRVESSSQFLTRGDYDEIMKGVASGKLNVAIYGRIMYSNVADLHQRSSIFCFYLLKNGQVSACPNYEHAYTNWIP
jgi:hypothetical protein